MTLAPAELEPFVAALRAGGVLACPTETQVGLLADASDERAVQRVCTMKQRPASEALPLIVPSLAVARRVVQGFPPAAERLAAQYWPGPLTLVLRAAPGLPPALIKDGTIALRVPGPSPALALVQAFGGALTATSANLSGQPPLAEPDELRAAFGAALASIVPGRAPGGAPSTIVDVTGETPRIVRQGAIRLPA
jgi:L-threonylcarbamoyladenylate synthase